MIIAVFKNGQTKVYTKSAHQFDKGQKLIMTGIALPESFEVHMSNEKEGGMAYSCKGSAEGVLIPDALFMSGEYVYVWLYEVSKDQEWSSTGYAYDPEEGTIQEQGSMVVTNSEQTTTYEIVIPVTRRSVQLPTVELDAAGNFYVGDDETLIPVRP